jgi:hypothetical protein
VSYAVAWVLPVPIQSVPIGLTAAYGTKSFGLGTSASRISKLKGLPSLSVRFEALQRIQHEIFAHTIVLQLAGGLSEEMIFQGDLRVVI